MSTNQEKATARRVLWQTPLAQVARTRKRTPEAWHAQCLHEEVVRLQAATRSLEFATGFYTGRDVGRVENVLANRIDDAEPGAAAESATAG